MGVSFVSSKSKQTFRILITALSLIFYFIRPLYNEQLGLFTNRSEVCTGVLNYKENMLLVLWIYYCDQIRLIMLICHRHHANRDHSHPRKKNAKKCIYIDITYYTIVYNQLP